VGDVSRALGLLGFAVRYAPQIAGSARRFVRSVGESLGAMAAWGGDGGRAGTGGRERSEGA